MQLITIKRDESKTPKDMLVELYDNNKGKTFIVMMSNKWFKEFEKCDGVEKDYYELNHSDYDAYFVRESRLLTAKCHFKIEVEYVAKNYIIIRNSIDRHNSSKKENIDTIFYFE